MISMPGGKQKAVENLEIGDVICTFDHEKSEVSSAPVCFIWESKNVGNAFTLTFEGDIEVTVIEEHGFYGQKEQKYVFINLQNAEEYIGHRFYNADSNSWLELKSCEALNGSVDAYAIITSGHLNHMSNGMLSMCDGSVKVIANLFEYDDQMKFDADKKKADIEAYGLTSKEKIMEFEGFLESDYDDYNLQYLNVAIGKGLTTWEWIKALSDYCVENGWVDIYSGSETAEENEAPKMLLMSAAAPKNLLGSAPELTAQDGIEIKANEDGTYTFIMPGYAVTVTAEFEEVPVHTHAFTYTVNGGKLTATCTAGCDKGYDTTPLTLTLTAPASLVYDGNAKAFTFADGEATAWTGAGLELPTIYYYEKKDYPFYMGIDSAPTDAGGDYKVEITVNKEAARIYFTIDKATPYIKTNPEPTDIVFGKKLSDSTLVGGYVQISSANTTQVGGLFEWKLGDTIPALSDSETTEYDVTFTPADSNNYNTVSCKVKIKVTHTHNPVLVNGQAATETAAGWRDYYECKDSADACHKYFEDATCKVEITNLDAWKSQTGNGYIAPLVHSIAPVNGKNATDTEAGYKPYYECKNCNKYYEDATGLIEISNIDEWKAESGAGYLAPLHGTDNDHNHICDYCDETISSHVDTDPKDHVCDYCGNTLSECADTDKDHKCDYCKKVISECVDADKDHKCDICGKQISEHNAILVEGTAATLESAGFKSYYKCGCGKLFEDATCKVEITDLDAWKAQGGAGYIAKLEEEPTSPQTGDTSNMILWVMLMSLSSMGLCLVLGKKRKKEQ